MLEADHLRKTLKTEEVIEPVEPCRGGSSAEEGANQNKKLKGFCCKEPECGIRYKKG